MKDIPTVVHCHEISHEKERVGQHAHSDLKAQKTSSLSKAPHVKNAISSFCMLPELSLDKGCQVQSSLCPQGTSSEPRGGRRRGKDTAAPTYPHHELGVAPDHRGLAELQRETKGVVGQGGDTRLALSLCDTP